MRNSSFRILIMALAVVAFMTVLPDTAAAAAAAATATTPAERADLWNDAVLEFSVSHPSLNDAQAEVLAQALRLGDEIATLQQQDESVQAVFRKKAARLLEEAREHFSNDELGALFTSMGPAQIWLMQLVAAQPAWCDCTGPGACQMPGGPTGECTTTTQCVTWEADGRRRNGLCSPAATPTTPTTPATTEN